MAHKKGQGSSRNGRDSNSQRLGVKAFGGQNVPGGTILVRQGHSQANLALVGDKSFIFNEAGTAFLMYGVEKRT